MCVCVCVCVCVLKNEREIKNTFLIDNNLDVSGQYTRKVLENLPSH